MTTQRLEKESLSNPYETFIYNATRQFDDLFGNFIDYLEYAVIPWTSGILSFVPL